ncbi:hypothetical protein GQ43DRAFT_362633 [Delitschia confertaspora ATCC 74209]|uniref:Spherulation-specific family 4 n=1 Tax=Delitschia confertaspora ATCC 74209 TaxID=1513339 RepID=A0A9P4N2Z3_9PLEO|nr:hypothetical protein GQ43DRAFT_362633 [Delitschia confertaspora ATCC 74209]
MAVDAASILLPLYVYPSWGAWQPLIDMATSYPRVHFTAIVNPHSGPGENTLSNLNYTEAIKSLNAMENIRTIGYVATQWCMKDINSVLAEVDVYAGWAEQHPSLAMHGIFFDETVSQYTADYVYYLQTISLAVHNSRGLADGFVVHNPGALPDAKYFSDPDFVGTANLTVVFEDTYSNWLAKADKLAEASSAYDPTALSCLLHSVPELSDTETDRLLQDILQIGNSIFLTGTNNYTRLDAHFPVYVECLDRLLAKNALLI